jgi:methylglyoxal synthase
LESNIATEVRKQNIALVAHDHMKPDLMAWVKWNHLKLSGHQLICTGTTGRLLKDVLDRELTAEEAEQTTMIRLKSGPLGGDQQLGAMIAEGGVDILIFFWDPMEQQPHDVDVKALLRLAVLHNIPTASNRASADYLISSPLFGSDYEPLRRDYREYLQRSIR